MPQSYDCVLCGACCVSPFEGEGYIHVEADEAELLRRLSLPVIDIASAEESLLLLGTRINRQGRRVCQALDGRVGRRVECAIYESRPRLCRQFEAGSPECLEARRAARV